MLCYTDGTNGYKATCRTLTTAMDGGDTLTAGEALVQSDGIAHHTSLSVMSSNTAMLCYRDMSSTPAGQGHCLPIHGHGDGTLQQGCDVHLGLVGAPTVSQVSTSGFGASRAAVCYHDDTMRSGTCNLLSGIYECSATGLFISTLAPSSELPPPSPPPFGPDVAYIVPTLSIANDPMFVVNGVHQHFWIPTGKLTPLLSWSTSRGTHREM